MTRNLEIFDFFFRVTFVADFDDAFSLQILR